jgi:hypothetical protein
MKIPTMNDLFDELCFLFADDPTADIPKGLSDAEFEFATAVKADLASGVLR